MYVSQYGSRVGYSSWVVRSSKTSDTSHLKKPGDRESRWEISTLTFEKAPHATKLTCLQCAGRLTTWALKPCQAVTAKEFQRTHRDPDIVCTNIRHDLWQLDKAQEWRRWHFTGSEEAHALVNGESPRQSHKPEELRRRRVQSKPILSWITMGPGVPETLPSFIKWRPLTDLWGIKCDISSPTQSSKRPQLYQ